MKKQQKPRNWWLDKEHCKEEASKYQTPAELNKHNGYVYDYCSKNNWLIEFYPDWKNPLNYPPGWWLDKEHCREEASKYNSISEFQKGSSSAYNSSVKNNWLKDFYNNYKKRIRKKINYWTKDKVFKEAKKYNSRGQFSSNNNGAYQSAWRNKWLDEMTWFKDYKDIDKDQVDCIYIYKFEEQHTIYVGRTVDRKKRNSDHKSDKNDPVRRFIEQNNLQWVEMEIIEDNLTIRQGIEQEDYWVKFYKSQGWILLNKAKPGSIGSIGSGKWTKKTCKEEAIKYKCKEDFRKNSRGAYSYCLRKCPELLNEIFPKNISLKPIDQLDLNGNYIQTFKSIREALKFLQVVSHKSLIKACREGKKYKGFYWKYHK